jgi:hypothetical protein
MGRFLRRRLRRRLRSLLLNRLLRIRFLRSRLWGGLFLRRHLRRLLRDSRLVLGPRILKGIPGR